MRATWSAGREKKKTTNKNHTHLDTKIETPLSMKLIQLMGSYHHLWRNTSRAEDQTDTPPLPFQMPRNGVALLIL